MKIAIANYNPSIVFLQETWLNAECDNIVIPNYSIVARRDRAESENRGGVITFCRSDLQVSIAHVYSSTIAERIWHVLVTQAGTVFLCNWYRPGASDNEMITSFRDEYIEYASDSLACIVAGDLNIHSKDWLRFSNANTREGDIMREICEEL